MVIGSILGRLDPFVVSLLGTVVLASLLPARGEWAAIAEVTADAGIVLLFFLHGAKLSSRAIVDGARSWRLHAATLATTFVLFPLAGLALTASPLLKPPLDSGLLFLTLLPSTVQSSIALTAIAHGNVAAAVCSASFSNFLGVFLTPALVAALMQRSGEVMLAESVRGIVLKLLLPFLLGHAMRPLIGGLVARHNRLTVLVDRGSILLVVYTAFGAAVVDGLWRRVAPVDLAWVLVLSTALLSFVLVVTWKGAVALGLRREDAIVLQFCGSKKSLASGVPMAGVLFPPAQVGAMILPLMVFHQIQLVACAALARRYARRAIEPSRGIVPQSEDARREPSVEKA